MARTAWPAYEHSRSVVNRAGATLADPKAREADRRTAISVVSNWRAAHSFPLNTIQMNLRTYATNVSEGAVVAQRLKRLESIERKLRNEPTMKLSQMQDIGGCRAVVSNAEEVMAIVERFRTSRARHELGKEYDYLANPKVSGYRGMHLVYKYRTSRMGNTVYNGSRIEVQIRSQIQHSWATAVEVVDLFARQALKWSEGERSWRRLFALMSTEFALQEGLPPVPKTPQSDRIRREQLRQCASATDAARRLAAYQTATDASERMFENQPNAEYCLFSFNWEERRLSVSSYEGSEIREATSEYEKLEAEAAAGSPTDTVLVRVQNLRDLRRAYPNYFADTRAFVAALRKATSA